MTPDPASRKEERDRRRAHRRAVHKHAITKLLKKIGGNGDDNDYGSDYEEKRAFLIEQAEEGASVRKIRVDDEILNAEEGRSSVVSTSLPSPTSTPSPVQEMSPVPSRVSSPVRETEEVRPLLEQEHPSIERGHEEELPAYEDHDGSDMGSVVADGFRYMPGSEGYSPSHSSHGSVSDILGPDVKS